MDFGFVSPPPFGVDRKREGLPFGALTGFHKHRMAMANIKGACRSRQGQVWLSLLGGLAVLVGAACQESADGDALSVGGIVQADAPYRQLEPAIDSHPYPFEVVAAIRELDENRTIVSDERATQLLLIDFRNDTTSMLGRSGRGPGEYQQVGRLWSTSGDTTLHKEPYAPRLLVLAGTEVVATIGGTDGAVRQFATTPILGVDSLGRVAIVVPARDSRGGTPAADSLLLLRVNWKTGDVDTLARIQSQEGWSVAAGVSTGMLGAGVPASGAGEAAAARRTFRMSIFAPDQVAVMPSGWTAIVRAEPYRVDWCSPEGECAAGQTIQSAGQELTDSDKELYLRRAAATFGWPPTDNVDETDGWPLVLPPFSMPPSRVDAAAAIAAPNDRVLVERTSNAGSMDTRYDLVDRIEGLVAWFDIPPTDRVVGFGSKHIYIVRTTEDGWQILRKHPWTF